MIPYEYTKILTHKHYSRARARATFRLELFPSKSTFSLYLYPLRFPPFFALFFSLIRSLPNVILNRGRPRPRRRARRRDYHLVRDARRGEEIVVRGQRARRFVSFRVVSFPFKTRERESAWVREKNRDERIVLFSVVERDIVCGDHQRGSVESGRHDETKQQIRDSRSTDDVGGVWKQFECTRRVGCG